MDQWGKDEESSSKSLERSSNTSSNKKNMEEVTSTKEQETTSDQNVVDEMDQGGEKEEEESNSSKKKKKMSEQTSTEEEKEEEEQHNDQKTVDMKGKGPLKEGQEVSMELSLGLPVREQRSVSADYVVKKSKKEKKREKPFMRKGLIVEVAGSRMPTGQEVEVGCWMLARIKEINPLSAEVILLNDRSLHTISMDRIRPVQPSTVRNVYTTYETVQFCDTTSGQWMDGHFFGTCAEGLIVYLYEIERTMICPFTTLRHFNLLRNKIEMLIDGCWYCANVTAISHDADIEIMISGIKTRYYTNINSSEVRLLKEWVDGNIWILPGRSDSEISKLLQVASDYKESQKQPAVISPAESSMNNQEGVKNKRIREKEEEEGKEKKSKANSPYDDCSSSTLPPSLIAKSVDSDDKDESMRSPPGDQGSSCRKNL